MRLVNVKSLLKREKIESGFNDLNSTKPMSISMYIYTLAGKGMNTSEKYAMI
jgi:hypothetical protein